MDPELYLTKVAQRAEEEMGRAVPGSFQTHQIPDYTLSLTLPALRGSL